MNTNIIIDKECTMNKGQKDFQNAKDIKKGG